MDHNRDFDLDSADELLNGYLTTVTSVRDKALRIAANQRAMADALRRTADALRGMAEKAGR